MWLVHIFGNRQQSVSTHGDVLCLAPPCFRINIITLYFRLTRLRAMLHLIHMWLVLNFNRQQYVVHICDVLCLAPPCFANYYHFVTCLTRLRALLFDSCGLCLFSATDRV